MQNGTTLEPLGRHVYTASVLTYTYVYLYAFIARSKHVHSLKQVDARCVFRCIYIHTEIIPT